MRDRPPARTRRGQGVTAQTWCSAGPRPRSSTPRRYGPERTRLGRQLGSSRSPARGTALRHPLPHRCRTRLEADLHVGRSRRCPPDVDPLRAPGSGRRTGSSTAPRRLPHARPTDPDCGARPHQRRNPSEHGVLKYRYRDSNSVAKPVTPVFIGFLGPISPAEGSWGQPETGHAAPHNALSLAPSFGAVFRAARGPGASTPRAAQRWVTGRPDHLSRGAEEPPTECPRHPGRTAGELCGPSR